MTSRIVIAALAAVLFSAGCMKDEGRSDSVATGTNVEGLHPAGMGSSVGGSVDSTCDSACRILGECGYLEGVSHSECVLGCEQGGMDSYLACILAAADCMEVGSCFY